MKSLKIDVNIIADYIFWTFNSKGKSINVTKLQKILYLAQAWYMVNFNKSIFDDDFQAWSYGPVCKTIFDRFNNKLTMAAPLQELHFNNNKVHKLNIKVKEHLDNIIDDYGELTFIKLEEFFNEHDLAYKKAREGLTPSVKSNNIISKEDIFNFYKTRIGTKLF